jgi:hypothetical protein
MLEHNNQGVHVVPISRLSQKGGVVCWCVVQYKLQSQAVEPSVKGVSMPNDRRCQGCRVCEFGDGADSRTGRAQKRLAWRVGNQLPTLHGGVRRRSTYTSSIYFHHTPTGLFGLFNKFRSDISEMPNILQVRFYDWLYPFPVSIWAVFK